MLVGLQSLFPQKQEFFGFFLSVKLLAATVSMLG